MTATLLDSKSPLTHLLPNFEPRQEQMEMLKTVEGAYEKNEIALIEAGTGIGKSIAYLIPAIDFALKRGERTVISTHTIALQQQLLNKDLPLLKQALNCDIQAVLVKGMSNYICKRKLQETKNEFVLLSLEEQEQFEKIEEWAESTTDGSRTDLPFLPKAKLWENVAAEPDTCTYRKCPHFNNCPFIKAREEAQTAQIIIVNHSLLMADLSIRMNDDNYEEPALLPPYKHLIIDEAHHLEEVATKSFAKRAGEIQMRRNLLRIGSDRKGRLSIICSELSRLKKSLPLELIAKRNDLLVDIVNAFSGYHMLLDHLKVDEKVRIQTPLQAHPLWKEEIVPATEELCKEVGRYAAACHNFELEMQEIDAKGFKEKTAGPRREIGALTKRLQEASSLMHALATSAPNPEKVPWIERRRFKKSQAIDLFEAELDVSKILEEALFKPFSSLVLCSATLTSNNNFHYFRSQVGLDELKRCVVEKIFPSPFDYEKQASFHVPDGLPLPNSPDFIPKANQVMLEAIQRASTGTFILFTSYAMLKECYDKLQEPLTKMGFTLFKQGDENRHALINKFRQGKKSVLFGADSFWEGVDVAGPALELVIITKLPFKVPTEPLIQARSEHIEQMGGSAFFDYSLPQAIVKFKQGVGRLIRNKKDRGKILCLDARITKKGYGKQFLKSLPPFKQESGSP